jgi:hypothetical protein
MALVSKALQGTLATETSEVFRPFSCEFPEFPTSMTLWGATTKKGKLVWFKKSVYFSVLFLKLKSAPVSSLNIPPSGATTAASG